MKKLHYIIVLLWSSFSFAQDIFLTEVKSTNNNSDKFLYSLKSEPNSDNQYLGRIEVSGFSLNDEEMFSQIYKKAKSIGSNTYVIKSPENIEGAVKFNPSHYYIYLYYTEQKKIAKEENIIYIINPSKEIQIRINDDKLKLTPRSFIKYNISKTEITDVSVGKFLGSRIKFHSKEDQPEQYFQISGKKISANSENSPGINYKTGDIIKLEKSYAQFLINIYNKN